MIDPTDLIDGVLRGVLGGRRKKSRKALRYLTGRRGGLMSNPNALLTVAGVAWGIFETLQSQGSQASPGGQATHGAQGPVQATPVPPIPTPPVPNAHGEAATIPSDALRIVRLAIAAAAADGSFTDQDRAKIVDQARAAGAEHLVDAEVAQRRPVAEIVSGVIDPAQRATLYVLAFGIIRADESVSGAERIFLAQLANQLGLDPETVKKLEADTSARIDSQN
jgi:uncharacterized membrane protein YebE (DUF533 family)